MTSERVPAAAAALDAKYEILRELGRGGTALVYLARDRSTGAEVAIKLIHAKYIDDEEAMTRFAREARFVARLHHPNIVRVDRVLDLGKAGMALVMPHVAGPTLKEVIRKERRLSPRRTEQIVRDVAAALGAAHGMGIVHRDVKPENIFIDADGRALLADFGLARSIAGDAQLTMSGVAIGTPAYMAPEQIDGGELDARGDVYSLGLVAWEMLTGRRPWDGESLYAVVYHQKHDLLPDVRDMRDDVPVRLADVIARSISKDRESRWGGMPDLLAALDSAVGASRSAPLSQASTDTVRFVRRPKSPRSVAIPPQEDTREPDAEQPGSAAELAAIAEELATLESGESTGRSRRRTAIAGGIVTALAVVVGVAVALAAVQGRPDEASPARPAPVLQGNVAGDVARPTAIGAPIGVVAGTTSDTNHSAATGPSAPAGRTQLPDTYAAIRGAPIVASGRTTVRSVGPAPAVASNPEQAARPTAPPGRPTADAANAEANSPTQTGAALSRTAPTTTAAAPMLLTPNRGPPVTRAVASRVSIVTGGMHSCLMGGDGRAFCWGGNEFGQLGTGGTDRASTPVLVGTDARFTALATGLSHSCAIVRGGAAWCWGENDHGQLGDPSVAPRLTPVRAADGRAFRAIVAGGAHTCGLTTDDIALCWGSDAHGQLGDNGSRDSAVPVAAGVTRFAAIAAGWNFTCALGTNGRASCWGENAAGQLGDGTIVDRHTPVPVASDIVFTAIAAGSEHACGVTGQGEIYCWGRNTNGQLGDGTRIDRLTPVRARGSARFASVTTGAVHTCAVTDGGEGFCWGRNTYGQLGDGTTTDQPQPSRVSGSHVFASVRAFGSHSCGATVSGEAFCWGYNLDGQLGDGTRVHRTRPVYVEPLGGK